MMNRTAYQSVVPHMLYIYTSTLTAGNIIQRYIQLDIYLQFLKNWRLNLEPSKYNCAKTNRDNPVNGQGTVPVRFIKCINKSI